MVVDLIVLFKPLPLTAFTVISYSWPGSVKKVKSHDESKFQGKAIHLYILIQKFDRVTQDVLLLLFTFSNSSEFIKNVFTDVNIASCFWKLGILMMKHRFCFETSIIVKYGRAFNYFFLLDLSHGFFVIDNLEFSQWI